MRLWCANASGRGVVAWIEGLCRTIGWSSSTADSDRGSPMPFKANAVRRHHIPKQKHKVTNWAAYDAGCASGGA